MGLIGDMIKMYVIGRILGIVGKDKQTDKDEDNDDDNDDEDEDNDD